MNDESDQGGQERSQGEVDLENRSNAIPQFVDLEKQVTKLVNRLREDFTVAYLKASFATLRDEDGTDYSRLKDDTTQQAFIKKLMENYTSIAHNFLPITIDPAKKPLQADMLMYGVFGVTSGQLAEIVKDAKEDYTLSFHETQVRNGVLQNLDRRLRPSASTHLTLSNREALVKYANQDSALDWAKMRLEDAISVARDYIANNEKSVDSAKYKNTIFYKAENPESQQSE
ncbi:hypothetical protein HY488_02405 [Candidatus Woesearchaeota archaeon]|nr:hypothetical protein [Candidatus Woesearchaeota archaeon]